MVPWTFLDRLEPSKVARKPDKVKKIIVENKALKHPKRSND